jgi:hypothetical protein
MSFAITTTLLFIRKEERTLLLPDYRMAVILRWVLSCGFENHAVFGFDDIRGIPDT